MIIRVFSNLNDSVNLFYGLSVCTCNAEPHRQEAEESIAGQKSSFKWEGFVALFVPLHVNCSWSKQENRLSTYKGHAQELEKKLGFQKTWGRA